MKLSQGFRLSMQKMRGTIMRCLAAVGAVSLLVALLILAKPVPAEEITLFSQGLLPVRKGKLWGYVNQAGEVVIEPQFQGAGRFGVNGLAIVETKKENAQPQYGAIDTSGNFVFPLGQYLGLHSLGLADRLAARTGEGWGILRLDGSWIAEPQFGSLGGSVSKNGLIRAKNHRDEWGFVDADGRWVIAPQYDGVKDFGDSKLAVVIVETITMTTTAERGTHSVTEQRQGAIDETGRLVIEPIYYSLTPFDKEGMSRAQVEGGCGFVDETGKWVIPPEFAYIHTGGFGSHDAVWASMDWKNYGLIDRRGRWLTPQTYTGNSAFRGGLTRGCVDKEFNTSSCLLDEKGRVVLEPVKGLGVSLDGELWWFNENGRIGYLDRRGNLVLPPVYEGWFSMSDSPSVGGVFFHDGYAVAQQEGTYDYGVIDKKGNWVVASVYDEILQPGIPR